MSERSAKLRGQAKTFRALGSNRQRELRRKAWLLIMQRARWRRAGRVVKEAWRERTAEKRR